MLRPEDAPTLAAIVRDLADVQVVSDNLGCTLCDGMGDRRTGRDIDAPPPNHHNPTCPWRRAIEWVAAKDGLSGPEWFERRWG